MSSDVCKDLLVEKKGGCLSDWKRRSKKRIGKAAIVRVFENTKTKEFVKVEETGTGWEIIEGESIFCDPMLQLLNNPILVPLVPIPKSKMRSDYSGRIVYSIDEEYEKDHYGGAGYVLGFYCGPEDKGGALDDSYDGGTSWKLEKLFKDFPDLQVWASENYHLVGIPHALKIEDAKTIIKDRLERSGAVKMEED